jgi:signal transduction histidine kinase
VRRRLLISFLGLTLLVLLGLQIPLAITYRDRETEVLLASLERDAFVLATYAQDSLDGSGDVRLQVLAEEYQQRNGARPVFVDADAIVRADSEFPDERLESFLSRPEIQAALDRRVVTGARSSESLGYVILYAAVPVTSGGVVQGAVRLTVPSTEVDERTERYLALLAIVAACALTGAALLAIVLSRWVTRPLKNLERVAVAIGEGELDARVPADRGPAEVRKLAQAINVTASRLEQLVGAQEYFVTDASHQLRTPLTALRLRLEMLELSVTDVQSQADLAAAENEVMRLSRLVDGLLALARADRAPAIDVRDDLDVDAMLTERASNWRPVADTRNVQIEVVSAGLTARVSPDRLSQIVDNYLANAIDVSPAGTSITLHSNLIDTPDRGPMVEIHIEDEGPGMTEQQRSQAFNRFWRSGDTTGALGGTGLGLPIVRKLASTDAGFADLRQARSGGLDAVVVLPSSVGLRPD